MELAIVASVVSVLAAISGILLGWKGHARTTRHETAAEAREDATIKADVEYIKRGVDEMRLEQKDQGRRYDALAERVTRVEESSKQAHHRIDRIDSGQQKE